VRLVNTLSRENSVKIICVLFDAVGPAQANGLTVATEIN